MVQLNQGDVRRYVGVASVVIGLVCYALSSSFNRLYGDSLKICLYIVLGSIICLAILLPEAWQRWRIFKYRALLTSLVMTLTTAYSIYLDKKKNMKPDAYGPISSAAFATASLCMSKQAESVFNDLLSFFCGLLTLQLTQIEPSLFFVGAGFYYFMVKLLRFYLDRPTLSNRVESQPPSAVVIDIEVPPLPSSAGDGGPQEEEEEEEEEEGTDIDPLLPSSPSDAQPEEEEGIRDVIPTTGLRDAVERQVKKMVDRADRAESLFYRMINLIRTQEAEGLSRNNGRGYRLGTSTPYRNNKKKRTAAWHKK